MGNTAGTTTRTILVAPGLFALGRPALAQGPALPLAFRASFDGTLDAEARGSGKPAKAKGPVAYGPGKRGRQGRVLVVKP